MNFPQLVTCNKCGQNVPEQEIKHFKVNYCLKCWLIYVKTNPKYAQFLY